MITSLIYLVIELIVLGVVVWLLIYLINAVPMGEPFATVARVIVTVLGCLIAILILLQFVGIAIPGAGFHHLGGGPHQLIGAT